MKIGTEEDWARSECMKIGATHHAGCWCHEQRHREEVEALQKEVNRLRKVRRNAYEMARDFCAEATLQVVLEELETTKEALEHARLSYESAVEELRQLYDFVTKMEASPSCKHLLPCPFCGPGNSVVECYQDDYGKWRVACGACGVHTGIRTDNDKEKVVSQWNTRAGPWFVELEV